MLRPPINKNLPTSFMKTDSLICVYPLTPLLKKFDSNGNYSTAGDLACRNKLFLKLDNIGAVKKTATSKVDIPTQFEKLMNVYQCVMCGAIYRIDINSSTVYMLWRDIWIKVDMANGILYLPDNVVKNVVMDISEVEIKASQQHRLDEQTRTDKIIDERYKGLNLCS
jgi:hypothetical protein